MRAIDNFIQEWNANVDNNQVLFEYKSFKTEFEYESYLDLVPENLRFFITKLRLSVHNLRIHSGRFGANRIPRNERYCLFCNDHDLEDIFHFVLKCPLYNDIRKRFINSYFRTRPSVFKLNQLLSTDNSRYLKNLAFYIKEAFKLRHSNINITITDQ